MGVFGDLNEVKLIGNITQDLELRHTNTGTSVTSFGLATNRSYKQGDDWKEEVSFHNIVVWSNDAEYLSQKARKGTRVFISGRLQTRSWEDKEGKKNYKTEVIADKIILLDRYERGTENSSGNTNSKPMNDFSSSKNTKPKQEDQSNDADDVINPDDLPF
ncbi:single-stranded DNA-binding protein [Candidatus Dojkabacteria bacterium]|nr:single-stranded DNA-binding protein [Candidatus Dojkabacteria bacterium]